MSRNVARALAVAIGCLAAEQSLTATTLNAVAAVAFEGESARLSMLDARMPASEHWTISPAVAYLQSVADYHEAQFRLSVTGAFDVGGWTIDNRHMVSVSSESVERYRLRLRGARTGLLGRNELSARAFDELYFDFDRSRVIRNNLAVGMGITINRLVSLELYRVWVDNKEAPDDAYVLGLMTIRLGPH